MLRASMDHKSCWTKVGCYISKERENESNITTHDSQKVEQADKAARKPATSMESVVDFLSSVRSNNIITAAW